MHQTHARAARALVGIALRGLQGLDVEQLTASDVAKLLDLGTRLERETLTVSVEELQGKATHAYEDADPFRQIADAFRPADQL